ncbi:ATP-dependent endonuclease [Methylobacter sp. BBA5.1]|uniref:ATP-dependent endonuclease n=1 Tax=Methylobacter sp. BBA5.1 TaxID=1495064 RepID=UPI00055BB495|nr:AAA family ATPase [Methylobacter sp. BBA5.1]
MKIAFFEIQNFRKLKSCRIELGNKETVFVGANNSGKTSAMDALILFLEKDRRKEIATTDFTLSNWQTINSIGKTWVDCAEDDQLDLSIDQWRQILPSVDIWLDVKDSEIHYVSHLIPTLSWCGGLIGVRLCFEPRLNRDQKLEDLYKEFSQAFKAAKSTVTAAKSGSKESSKAPKLWPQSLRDFLDEKLTSTFTMNAYLLDPAKLVQPQNGTAQPQELSKNSIAIGSEPFDGLFKIDIINAQRGFSDPKSSDKPSSSSLSAQLRSYYDKHLNPSELPGPEDIDALSAIDGAREIFDSKLKLSFSSAILELEELGYPGFSNPTITIVSKVNPLDGLSHDSAVQFNLMKSEDGESPLALPEKYNGLGYQNLISMVFKLIRFRDEWMRKGKVGKRFENEESIIEPLHLVLIEEPEAHLHAQVQQVFIKKAYTVLRNHEHLKDKEKFTTQLIVSTHSSHIAHEIDFSCLRYFGRKPAITSKDVPCAALINLSETFGNEDETAKFASRYLKTTHCDLFFADAVILVEGPAERMLVPHFIRSNYPVLDSLYVTVLEIGGSHAHRLKPLIEKLGLITLVITDLDSIENRVSERPGKVRPQRGKKYKTGNDTLKDWHPNIENLDEILNCSSKVTEDGLIRVAYQYPIIVNYNEREPDTECIPYTFEDALALSNIDLLRGMPKATGLLKKICNALLKDTSQGACKEMFEALSGSAKKAEMALDLLYLQEPDSIKPPRYIAEGLEWLQNNLREKIPSLLATEEVSDGVE